ncbi:hypothetical protein HNR42_001260 [Deinobacterium chartae]|uniref:Uncharacterized protein n=1 Tax=Deinobacterium chartae TaxID=521158 RepID=A0A841HWR9_9DEIO|nr:hypothetical protein [Deinobacterium chartae]MBB6097837.1 hypothetical protein [Deinobacterium chartae]
MNRKQLLAFTTLFALAAPAAVQVSQAQTTRTQTAQVQATVTGRQLLTLLAVNKGIVRSAEQLNALSATAFTRQFATLAGPLSIAPRILAEALASLNTPLPPILVIQAAVQSATGNTRLTAAQALALAAANPTLIPNTLVAATQTAVTPRGGGQ